MITFRAQIAQANGLTVTVNLDQSTVFLSLDRWADHLDGAGGVDQHPVATTSDPGLMSAADKTALDDHIGAGGTDQHPAVTDSVAGFMISAQKTKLDAIEPGAEVNQYTFSIVKVGAVNIVADSKTDTLELIAGANILLTPDATNDRITVAVTGVAPSSHVGSGGSEHAVVTTTINGFMLAADKVKLNGIADGAEVNQNTFSNVKVGSSIIAADSKTDQLEIAAGSNIVLTADTDNDKITFSLGELVALLDRFGASASSSTEDWNDCTRPGTYTKLLYGDNTNGPGGHQWFHVFNLEYGAARDGSGNITQLAIPYSSTGAIPLGISIRGRYNGTWGSWSKIWTAGNDGSGSGLDADLLDGSEATDFVSVASDQTITGAKTFTNSNPITGAKFKITQEGGYAIKLTNKTGTASVKGTLVDISSTVDSAFVLSSDTNSAIGTVYENGIADGSECWVVVAGIAPFLLAATETATRGQYINASVTPGRVRTDVDYRVQFGIALENATAGSLFLGLIKPSTY